MDAFEGEDAKPQETGRKLNNGIAGRGFTSSARRHIKVS